MERALGSENSLFPLYAIDTYFILRVFPQVY